MWLEKKKYTCYVRHNGGFKMPVYSLALSLLPAWVANLATALWLLFYYWWKSDDSNFPCPACTSWFIWKVSEAINSISFHCSLFTLIVRDGILRYFCAVAEYMCITAGGEAVKLTKVCFRLIIEQLSVLRNHLCTCGKLLRHDFLSAVEPYPQTVAY